MKLPLLVAAFWLLARAAFAAEPPAESDYFLRVWRIDDGLPPLTTATLIEAPEGYLWMEAALGLVRFDGEHFTMFPAAALGWPMGAKVAKIFADGTQGLWVTLSNGSLWRERGGRWVRWAEASGDERISVMHPARDAEGGMFAGTTQKRLLRCTDTAPGLTEVFPRDATIKKWLTWPGSDGSVWFTRADGAYYWLGGHIEPAPLATPDQKKNFFFSWNDGSIWIIGDDYVSQWREGAFHKLPPIPDLAPQTVAGILPAPPHGVWASTTNRIYFLPTGNAQWRGPWPWATRAEQRQLTNLPDVNGHHWITTYGFGFLHVSPDGRQIPERLPPEFAANRILNLIEDRERNLWAVVEGSGLVRLRARRFTVHSGGRGLSDPEVMAVAEDVSGAVWAGSRAGGADVLKDGVWRHVTLPPGNLPAAGVTALLPQDDGNLVVGTFSQGVWRKNGDTWERWGREKSSSGRSSPSAPAVCGRAASAGFLNGRTAPGAPARLSFRGPPCARLPRIPKAAFGSQRNAASGGARWMESSFPSHNRRACRLRKRRQFSCAPTAVFGSGPSVVLRSGATGTPPFSPGKTACP